MRRLTIRVAHIIPGLRVGGAEKVLTLLALETDPSVITSTVISIAGEGPLAESLRQAGVPLRVLDLREYWRSLVDFVRLILLLRRDRPELVQTWLYHGDVIGGLAARMAGVKTVVWNLRVAPDLEELEAGIRIQIRLAALLSRWVPRRIVACAAAVRDAHIDLGYVASPIVLIPNGFELPLPDETARIRLREDIGLPPDTLLVGRVARNHPHKDHGTFLRAARGVVDVRSDIHFVLCGEGMTNHNMALMNEIEHLGIAPNIHLLGPLDDTARFNAALDVACSSSVIEGFPNAIGEAMACGVPVVATNVGGTSELVGKAGLLVPRSNPRALATALLDLIDSPDDRSRLGALARERIAEQFGVDLMVNRYVSLYKDLATNVRD